MKLTLYKNCILSNSYSEVFDVVKTDAVGKTAFDNYLATLSHSEEITVDNVYLTNQGKITLDYDIDTTSIAYDYNYLKLEDTYGISRYAFIDDMTIVNDLVVINYTEDVWHTYANTMHVRKSLLTRSRITSYVNGQTTWNIPFYAPSMTYEGNNGIIMKNVEMTGSPASPVEYEIAGTFSPSFNNCYVIAEMQFYSLYTPETGTYSDRQVRTVMIGHGTGTPNVNIRLDDAINITTEIVIKSSVVQFSGGTAGTSYYQVTKFLFIPEIYDLSKHAVAGTATIGDYTITLYDIWDKEGIIYKAREFSLSNDFKRLSIGTFTHQIQLVNSGNSLPVKLLYSVDAYGIKTYINVQNQVIDVTNDFVVEVPVSAQSADVTQQQASARELASLNAHLTMAKGSMQIVGGVTSIATGAASLATGNATGELIGTSGISGGITGIAGGVMSMIEGNKKLEIANRAMFTTNKGITASSNGVVNGSYGIVTNYIDADNDTEVTANIDNTGYVCNEIVDDLIFRNDNTAASIGYNVVQFDFANIYGKFPQRIVRKLKEILYNGVKVWYTTNV